ncbi:Insulin-like growth factor binding protein, N-terminal [Pseudocohnilembus persalinus]|uniref:Insulin-like growth factor binding protein, N-terminal n=1 Tax=Pseudocohnilembus persalinus TaxID=266149 RepID=A0A0V0QJ49_PSEPJ|nr:Insulin-like growth factor binding protein, N-terminal [Pseudocohnilembus persalinus]|eukprot:KRX02171.1 Insulin-like growth factor binding protein, N-terminal [Pseudocohnilembus persalinus]
MINLINLFENCSKLNGKLPKNTIVMKYPTLQIINIDKFFKITPKSPDKIDINPIIITIPINISLFSNIGIVCPKSIKNGKIQEQIIHQANTNVVQYIIKSVLKSSVTENFFPKGEVAVSQQIIQLTQAINDIIPTPNLISFLVSYLYMKKKNPTNENINGAIIRLIEEKNFYASDATQIAYKDYVEGDSSNYQKWTPIDPTTNTYSTSSNVCTVTSKCNKNAAFANHFYALQFTANKDFKRKISITQPHYQVDVQIGILVYGYDQFSATDYFQTWFDNTDLVSIMQTKYVKADYTTRGQYCYDWWDTKLDTSQREGRYLANLSYTHTNDILWVINKWVSLSNYDQNNLQLRWGVYQFILDYYECHATCKTCTGAANTDCLTCPTTPTLYYKFGASSPYQCLTTCPAGYFQDTSEPEALCSQCNSRCSACYGSSYNKCTACNAGYNLSGNTCQLTCTSNCLTCKENPDSANTCTSCASPRYLYNYSCILTCPAGFYPYVDGTTDPYRWCKACNSKCSSCTDYSTCTACNAGFYLQGSTCYSDCPNGYYESGSVCNACNAACETCTGGSSFNCNDCADNYYYHNVDGGCYATCPNYYYKDDLKYPPQCTLCTTLTGLHISGTGVCTPCQNNCKTCNPDIFTCTACYADRFIQADNTCWKCEDDLGYQTNPSNIHECQEICGDGIRVDPQTECDDGNSINGDGCSNLCKIESGYKCLGGSTSSPDVCVDTNQIAWIIYESDEDKEFINKKENEPFTFKIRFSKKFTFSTSTNLEEQLQLYISEKYDPSIFKVIIQQLSDTEYFIEVYFNMTIQYETLQITFKNPDQFQDIAGFTLEDKTEELNINIYYFSTKAQRKSVAIFTVIGFYLAVYNLDITENQRFGVGWALTIILFIILLVHLTFLKINAFIEIRSYIRRRKLEKQYKIHKQILKQMDSEKENEIQDFQEYFAQQNRNQIDEIFEAEENQDIQSRMDRVYGRERGRGKKKTLAQKFTHIIQKHSENISRNQTIINNLNVEKTNINSADPRQLMNKTKNSRIIKKKEGTYFIPQNIQNLVIHNSEYPSQQTSKNPTIYKGVALQDYDSQRNSNQKLVSEKNSDPDSEIYSQNMIMDSHVDNLTNTNYSQFSTQQKQYQNPNYQRTILQSERKLQQNSKNNIRQPIFRQTQNGGMIINPGSDAEVVEQLDDDQQQMQKIKDKLKDQNVANNNKNYKQNRAQQRKLRNQLAKIDKKKNDPITDFLYGQQNQKNTQEPVISKQLKDEVVKYESEIRRTNQRDNTVYRTLRLTRDKFKLTQIQNQDQK